MKTLLAIGDPSRRKNTETSSFIRFKNYKNLLKEMGMDPVFLSYQAVLDQKLPQTKNKEIIIFLFFPYVYWNKNIETYIDSRIYGDHHFGKIFKNFFTHIDSIIRKTYSTKKIIYINPPSSIKKDRDKKAAKRILSRNGIPTPPHYDIKTTQDIFDILNSNRNLYIKPRYGAMGKGISYLQKDFWHTNFSHNNGSIVCPRYDYKWKFDEFTGNLKLLKELAKAKPLYEEEISSPTIRGRRFDLRIYVVYGNVPYFYVRSAPKKHFVTNWSQGGKRERESFLKNIPTAKLNEAKQLAIKTAATFKMNFCGVDIIFSKGFKQAYVLELQSFPSHEKEFDLFTYLSKCL